MCWSIRDSWWLWSTSQLWAALLLPHGSRVSPLRLICLSCLFGPFGEKKGSGSWQVLTGDKLTCTTTAAPTHTHTHININFYIVLYLRIKKMLCMKGLCRFFEVAIALARLKLCTLHLNHVSTPSKYTEHTTCWRTCTSSMHSNRQM